MPLHPGKRRVKEPKGERDLANPIVTLTTDYGTSDHLVGVLKGVILKINPEVQIVDITHQVTPFDLLDGALAIASAYAYFPPRTIHVVVVDPGVGTERRPLLVSGQNQYFIAPDNGVLSGIFEKEQNIVVRHLTKPFTGATYLPRWRAGFRKTGNPAAWGKRSPISNGLQCQGPSKVTGE